MEKSFTKPNITFLAKALWKFLSEKKALAKTPPPKSRKNSKLNVVWEDEAILVVEKPAGLLSVATDKLEKIPYTRGVLTMSEKRMRRTGAS